ncbi:long-subunit fatty acid transport protein [Loktanella ponticola]|uniref:Long-subunit fatty acid transport protein n=1 Tax=Yoonia ponticola TaxID=1524255 RepID=A0A7W9BKF5_9RHOB|nr:outer membrane protein transport protein [Yoonia ponticola]MBB5721907.1 long-subunit fatty acid transport protein [Yoonia ponticola]
MKNTLKLTAALMLTTTAATAGGIERGGNGYSVLFEEGTYVALSFSSVKPDVSGDYPAALGGGSTGNMSEDYSTASVALKYELNDQFDVGLFLNQPYGANADYPDGVYAGLSADWESSQIALVLKYQATPNISVFGGIRSVESEADIAIPDALIRKGLSDAGAAGNATAAALAGGAPAGTLGYTAETDASRETSYILGAAYERPEIALRVALTYETGYKHKFAGTESVLAVPSVSGTSDFEIEMPQSVTLDFQTGVAADTLVFGSIRWAEWSVWEVRPNGYEALTNDRVTGIDDDVTTFRLGVGRQINEDLSVFARVTYEDGNGSVASRLSPTDGSTAFGIGGSYTYNNVKFTGGLEYIKLGEATDDSGVEFADNDAIGLGLTVGYQF